MSEQGRIVSIAETAPPKTFPQRLLDGVEAVGNKVPHPAVIFFILAGVVVVFSHIFFLLGTSVDYEVVNPQTHQVEHATATVNSLLRGDGIRFMLTSMVRNFMNFGPVGIILVVMIGVGLAEQAGLMTALIKKIVQVTPHKAVTWILVTVGVLASVAADAGYLVLIPLGAAAFLSLGRHPLAALAAAFSGVAAVFGVNFLIPTRPGPNRNYQRRDPPFEPHALDRCYCEFLFRGRVEPRADRRLRAGDRANCRAAARQISG
jgi:aminobenzoyl-glutamate transport protein